MKIYVIRHGEDIPGFRGGWSTLDLTPLGISQAENFAKRVIDEKLDFDYILTSDLPRALHTALIISNTTGHRIEINRNWREYNNGELAGMRDDIATEKYPGLTFATIGYEERYPNGETPKEYHHRILKALEEIKLLNKNVLIVTHGGVMDVLAHELNGISWRNNSPLKKHYQNTEMIEFDI